MHLGNIHPDRDEALDSCKTCGYTILLIERLDVVIEADSLPKTPGTVLALPGSANGKVLLTAHSASPLRIELRHEHLAHKETTGSLRRTNISSACARHSWQVQQKRSVCLSVSLFV